MAELISYKPMGYLDETFFSAVKAELSEAPDDGLSPGNHFARFTIDAAGKARPVVPEPEAQYIWEQRVSVARKLHTIFAPLIERGRDNGYLQGIDTLLCDADRMLVDPSTAHRGIAASVWHVDYVHDYPKWDELIATEGPGMTTEVAVGTADVHVVAGFGLSRHEHLASIHGMNDEVNGAVSRGELQIVRPESRQIAACSGSVVHRSPLNHTGGVVDRTFVRIMPANKS